MKTESCLEAAFEVFKMCWERESRSCLAVHTSGKLQDWALESSAEELSGSLKVCDDGLGELFGGLGAA